MLMCTVWSCPGYWFTYQRLYSFPPESGTDRRYLKSFCFHRSLLRSCSALKPQDCRIIQVVRNFRTFLTLLQTGEVVRSDQVVQGFVESGDENHEGQRQYNYVKHHLPPLGTPQVGKPFRSKSVVCLLRPIISHPPTTHCCEGPASVSDVRPSYC